MLTVKLTKPMLDETGKPSTGRFSTKIIEAVEVDIHILRPGELYEVAGTGVHAADVSSNPSFAFYIANPEKERPSGFADCVDFWSSAYIENSAGKTTEVVRF